jgi:pimeloyl-ACP methyl ester carboxylesterase
LINRPLVIIPGILTSGLGIGDDNSWEWLWKPAILLSGIKASLLGDPRLAKDDAGHDVYNGIVARQIWKDYDKLIHYLVSQGYVYGDSQAPQTLFTIPYDWRNSNIHSAENEINSAIKKIKETGFDEVDIIAHSMGGLVSRWFIDHVDKKNSVKNLIMLASPNFGAPFAYEFLKLGRFWDLPIPKLPNLARHFPSLYELLPDDYYFENIVEKLNNTWVAVDKSNNPVTNAYETYIGNNDTKLPSEKGDNANSIQNFIDNGLSFKKTLGNQANPNITTSVFYSKKSDTVGGYNFSKYFPDGIETVYGDIVVPGESELLDGANSYSTNADHVGMLSDSTVHAHIAQILGINEK